MIGHTLNNRYKITSRLGKGAMGTVYRATDTQSSQDVALKVISSELVVDPEMLERFKREGEALRQLKHPNIVGFMDAFEHDEHYVIVMEFVSGGSLYELIKAGPLPIEQARQITLDLCDALIRAHRLNIIHRDLKPENILIDQDGTPKLADFGVARLSEGTRMTRSGTQVGTPYYMSPEAWEGKTLDAQADIWSLGVILFEMLSGQVPFGGDTGAAVMNKVLTAPPPDLKKLRTEVPSSLVKIVGRMLTRDKKRRYQTMRQVAVDLESVQSAALATRAKAGRAGALNALLSYKFLLIVGLLIAGGIFSAKLFITAGNPIPTSTPMVPITPTQTSIVLRVTEPPAPPEASAPTESQPFIGTIKIATQSPLSGGQSLLGVAIKQGAELALEQLSSDLIAMGFDVQLAPYDDQATPDVGVANAKIIVADASILCGVGHLNSGVMIPSSEEYHSANLPFVSPANTNPVVTTRGYLEINRVVGRDDVQAPAAEEYAFTDLGAKSVYIIHDKTAYGQGVAEFFRKAAEDDGLEVLGFEGTEETANFDAIITPLLAAAPDVLFFSGIYNQAGVFFKQARDAGYEGTFMGTDGMDASDLAALAGDALTKGGGMVYTSVAGPASAYPKAAQFAKDFEAKFGIAPEPFAAQAYDSMGICLTAIKNAAEAAGGIPTRNAVAQAIRALTYGGLTGTIQFDNIGDLPVGRYFIVKVNATSGDTWDTNEIVAEIEKPSPGN